MKIKQAMTFELAGLILYWICIIIAMIFYPGGTMDDPSIIGYSFWGNTFSDTGRLVAHNGESNLISMIFFSIAYISSALLIIPLLLIMPQIFASSKGIKHASQIGSLFGLISSACLIGVVFTPADILRPPHMIFAYVAYAAIFFMSVAYSYVLFKQDKLRKFQAYNMLIFSVFFFIMLMFEIGGLTGLRTLLIIGQKLGRFAYTFSFLILTIGLWKSASSS